MVDDGGAPLRQAVLAGHRGDVATARRLLTHPDGAVREVALGALDRIGALGADDLERGRTDPEPRVRRRAAELASTFRWPDASPFLVPLLGDADRSVAEVAAWACGERRPTEAGSVEALAAMATAHDDPLCREAAVAALGAIGDDAGVPAIVAGLDDKPAVRRRAVIALAPFAGPDVDAALERALGDRDRQVRQVAEDLLGRRGG